MPISGVALGAVSVGSVFLYAGLKGVSVPEAVQAIVQGKSPATLTNRYPVTTPAGSDAAPATGGASKIVQIAATMKGQCYGFGAGHGNPCGSKCTDCSSYVSCVLSKATGRRIDMATGGLARIGTAVPYAQRQAGDIIVWNGGTGGGHCGIIIDSARMWHNPCTGCGGVQIGRYPYSNRTAAAAVVRRVT
jgi:cell wall-associated NlpC family hydrolase